MHLKSHFHRDDGLKHLIMQPTTKIDLPIYFSRIRPPMRLGVPSNWKWPTSVNLVLMHGIGFPLRRGRHLIHIAHSVSVLDTSMVLRDIYSLIFPRTISSLSVVSNLRKVSCMYFNSCMHTFFHPPVRDDEHAYAGSSSYDISDS